MIRTSRDFGRLIRERRLAQGMTQRELALACGTGERFIVELIPPAEGDLTTLRQGGDDGGNSLPEIPQKTVALFTPPVQAGPNGIVTIPLDLPDFKL